MPHGLKAVDGFQLLARRGRAGIHTGPLNVPQLVLVTEAKFIIPVNDLCPPCKGVVIPCPVDLHRLKLYTLEISPHPHDIIPKAKLYMIRIPISPAIHNVAAALQGGQIYIGIACGLLFPAIVPHFLGDILKKQRISRRQDRISRFIQINHRSLEPIEKIPFSVDPIIGAPAVWCMGMDNRQQLIKLQKSVRIAQILVHCLFLRTGQSLIIYRVADSNRKVVQLRVQLIVHILGHRPGQQHRKQHPSSQHQGQDAPLQCGKSRYFTLHRHTSKT